MKRAVFYIANHPNFIAEASRNAESVKFWLNLDTFMFTPLTNVSAANFDRFVELPKPKYGGWYRNSVYYLQWAANWLSEYDQLLYLDTDTYVCRDCSGIWRILDNYDLALGHAAGRGATPTANQCPSEFATLGVGVNFFNNTPKMRQFFGEWLRQYEAHYDAYGETDEGPLRDLLFVNSDNVRFFVLAPEEHCRFGFGVWLNGSVSILHGRVDVPLSEIARQINAATTMRLYRYMGRDAQNMLWWYH